MNFVMLKAELLSKRLLEEVAQNDICADESWKDRVNQSVVWEVAYRLKAGISEKEIEDWYRTLILPMLPSHKAMN